jgi:muconolactone delta-isomerase
MPVLAHLTFRSPDDLPAFLALRAEEARTVWGLYAQGRIREASLRQDLRGAVLTFEAPDLAAVEADLATFPAVKAGVFQYELIALGPFLSFETLFAPAIGAAP